MNEVLTRWPARRWALAGLAGLGYALAVGVPTDLIDTPLFGRQIPPVWWSWPALLVSSVLGGLLAATYVSDPRQAPARAVPVERAGMAGGLLTFFAVGCPVCNKVVLLALGSSGAISWFEPVQPLLQLAAMFLLGWALRRRLASESACPRSLPRRRESPYI